MCARHGTSPCPVRAEEVGKDIQKTGMIFDLELTAKEMGQIKRGYWSVKTVSIMY